MLTLIYLRCIKNGFLNEISEILFIPALYSNLKFLMTIDGYESVTLNKMVSAT